MNFKNNLYISLICLGLFNISCSKKELDPQKIFAGESSRKWKADRETTGNGEKDPLTKDEKKEVIEFYSSGKFNLSGGAEPTNGTWTYDNAGKSLIMKVDNAPVTMSYVVEELENDEIKLKAADGSTMELDAE